jgi:nucleotide-binding universal stress UspA family protein
MDIVVGYLKTPQGEAALETAVRAARSLGATLTIVHTVQAEDDDGEEMATYEAALADISDRLEANDIEHRTRILARGMSPAEDILTVASEIGAELIVVGLRRRSPVGKALLGSDAQSVLLDAKCPVLTVKADSVGRRPRVHHHHEAHVEPERPARLNVDPRDAAPTN